jgi:hypothetical protein
METKVSLLYSQETANKAYCESVKFSPHPHTLILCDTF